MRIVILKQGKVLGELSVTTGRAASYLIGRDSGAAISLSDIQLSRRHVTLAYDGSAQFSLTDPGSTNGTFVNGKRLEPNKQVIVSLQDVIKLGENSGILLIIGYDENLIPPEDERTILKEKKEKSPSGTSPSSAASRTRTGHLLDQLNERSLVIIGRSAECELVLPHQTVSRRHASIEKKEDNSFTLTDLGSANGTYLNGKRITHAVEISESDVILIGRYLLRLNHAVKDISTEVAVKATQIKKEFAKGKVGLHESSFEINAKALLAIMGPSGCGKSTLLKALNGDSPATYGTVYICGLELNSNYEYLKTLIGYVPQDDIVHMELTVEQCLTYAGRLRIENATTEQIQSKIEQVLVQLKIEHIRHSLIGKISGGQRKRVSIAVEILNDPMILFLDEPTSPLDPQTIEEFLNILRSLAAKGTTVVMVTHKTDDLLYMDSVIFMAEGGHMTYYGDTRDYLKHFGVDNTVKVYSNLGGEEAVKWAEHFKKQQHGYSYPIAASPVASKSVSTNYSRQYWWLTKRYFKIKLNDRVNTMIMVFQAPIIALLLCLIFKQVNQVVLFLMAICAIWFGTSNAAREIVGEAAVYRRERMYNLGILPYIFSKITVLISFAALQSFLFTAIIKIRYPDWEHIGGPFLWMLYLSFAGTMLGLMLSAAANSSEKVMSVVPIVLIPQIMLSGVIVKINNATVEVISYLTFSRWGTEGFSVLQPTINIPKTVFNNETGMAELSNVETVKVNALDYIDRQFHPDFSHLYGSLRADCTAILLISTILFIAVIFLLKKKDSIKVA